MHAQPGDRLVIRGHHVGDADRAGQILDVQGNMEHRPTWFVGVSGRPSGHDIPEQRCGDSHPKRKAPAKLKSAGPD